MYKNNVVGIKIAHTRRPEIELVNAPLPTFKGGIFFFLQIVGLNFLFFSSFVRPTIELLIQRLLFGLLAWSSDLNCFRFFSTLQNLTTVINHKLECRWRMAPIRILGGAMRTRSQLVLFVVLTPTPPTPLNDIEGPRVTIIRMHFSLNMALPYTPGFIVTWLTFVLQHIVHLSLHAEL